MTHCELIVQNSETIVTFCMSEGMNQSQRLQQCGFILLCFFYAAISLRVDLMHARSLPQFAHRINKSDSLLHILRRDERRIQSIYSKLYPTRKANGTISSRLDVPLSSGLSAGSPEYFVKLNVGTPPKPVYLIMDTGSDVTWIQCATCTLCYNQLGERFDSNKSSTYENIPCSSELCTGLDGGDCDEFGSKDCTFTVRYLDQSGTSGPFALDVFSVDGEKIGTKLSFGCGENSVGALQGAAGLLGMGGGPVSFPTQLGPTIGAKFSYCMVDRDSPLGVSSPMRFGSDAFPDDDSATTPLLFHPLFKTYYYAQVTGISVDQQLLDIPADAFRMTTAGFGGTIIDSGTTLTYFREPAYEIFLNAFRRRLGKVERVKAADFFCFVAKNGLEQVPDVSLHFEGGVTMVLSKKQVVIPVSTDRIIYCLAFSKLDEDLSIIGNVQQQTFRMGFDLNRKRIYISPPYRC